MKYRIVSFAALLALANTALAGWILDPKQSTLNFTTVKANALAEVHPFTALAGSLSDDGKGTVEIDLASVETIAPDRDQRLRDILFEVAEYPVATVSANVDPSLLGGLKAGEPVTVDLPVQLDLHGLTSAITTRSSVLRLEDGGLMVTSIEPAIVFAALFDLLDGIEALREIAGLPSIAPVVSVSYTLYFDEEPG